MLLLKKEELEQDSQRKLKSGSRVDRSKALVLILKADLGVYLVAVEKTKVEVRARTHVLIRSRYRVRMIVFFGRGADLWMLSV